jgi:hypothetical protein
MDAAVRLAISKFCDDDARAEVAPGIYNIDQNYHLKGQMIVSEDYERAATQNIPHLEVLALTLYRAGVTRDKTIELIGDSVRDVLEDKDSAVGCIKELFPEIVGMIDRIKRDIVGKLPKQQCKGAVKVSLVLDEVVVDGGVAADAKQILKDLGFAAE